MESGVKDEKPLALRTWSLNGGVIRIQLTRLADFADGDAIHGAIHAFTKALAGSRAPSDAALVEALEDVTAHLAAAISLLSRSPKTGAASNKMFDQMLIDYDNSAARGRAALAAVKGQQP